MSVLVLKSLAATMLFGRCMAACAATNTPPPVLMRGDLGAGKTTFIRSVVAALPGSDKADVSSPSFNIVNLYPTTPEVAHFDLYRTAGQGVDADLEELLFDARLWCLMEWAEYLPAQCIPPTYLALDWTARDDTREVRLHAHGAAALNFMHCVLSTFASEQSAQ